MSQREDFIQAVADIDDGDPTLRKITDDLKESIDLGCGQGRRGLVHDDDSCLTGQCPGDLDELLVRGCQPRAGGVEIDCGAEPAEEFSSQPSLLAIRHKSRPARLLAQEDVFSRCQPRNQVELLVNHGNSSRPGFLWRPEGDLAAVEFQNALVRGVDAAEHLDERALASAVFTQEGKHFAGGYIEIDAAKRLHAGE